MNEGVYVGEVSISLAAACFPDMDISGDKGYTGHDVLYLGFTGKNTTPGKRANWSARSFSDFEASLAPIGDALVARLSDSPEQTPDSSNSDSDSGSNSSKDGQARIRSWSGVCLLLLSMVFAIF